MFTDTEMQPVVEPRSRTINVLILLMVAALVFSYLGAYAVTNTLVAADMLPRWAPKADPRPRWMLIGFVTLLGSFGSIALVLRFLSGRQLRSLDALADAEDKFHSSDS